MEFPASATSASGCASGEEACLAPLVEFLDQSQKKHQIPGIALGTFELLHAGTVRFMHQANRECSRLFACVLPRDNSQSGDFLRLEERVRLLLALEQISGACLIRNPGILPTLARRWGAAVKWFRSDSECDIADGLWLDIARSGASAVVLPGDGSCTTSLILKRMASGKPA